MKNLRVGITASAVLGLLVLTVSCGTVTPGGSDSTVVPVYYATDRKPLMPLETWQQKSRAGDGGRNVAVCEGIDTVDASDVDTDTLGHNYLATSRAVIADAADIICRSLPPEQRNLTRMSSNGLAYWKLKKPE